MPANDELWPPQSARHALLSSPSGRKRYADFQNGKGSSPIKQLSSSPKLLERLKLARRNEDEFAANDEDFEDEETLQLKLAAIEAKLKLKKLQNKAKREDDVSSSRPMSASGNAAPKHSETSHSIEVRLSPIKRPLQATEPRSPSRVVLGIDKGVRGADISLRRARTAGSSPVKERVRNIASDVSRSNTKTSTTPLAQQRIRRLEIKSFSERMAEVRDQDKLNTNKRETAVKMRTRTFNLDAMEMEKFKMDAENRQNASETSSAVTRYRGVSPPELRTVHQSSGLRKTKTLPDLRDTAVQQVGDAALFEGFSRTNLSSRILPHSFLKRTLPQDQFTTYCVPDLLKDVVSPAYELPDEVGDYVVFGIIASKSSPLDQNTHADQNVKSSNAWEQKWEDGSQNRRKFIVMTLTDLKWTIDLYLFDTAVPRYHRLTPGTVIAVLNPSIMPPKKGKEDTGAFSLALHDGDDTVLEIGTSSQLGFCNVVKKNGKECGQWVDGAKTEICEWHLNAQIAKTQARRMGVNTGANGFGSKDSRTKSTSSQAPKSGRGYDFYSDSHYYITTSSSRAKGVPTYNPAISTVNMLDAENDHPFIAGGQFSRDKEALIQKRLASQEKERDIARRLATFGSGTSAGANYMRKRAHGDSSLQPSADDVSAHAGRPLADPSSQPASKSASTVHDTAHNLKSEIGRKRTAQDVRLSPVRKKTRFLTDRGIREAGRESLGSLPATTSAPNRPNTSDDDDDLDIV